MTMQLSGIEGGYGKIIQSEEADALIAACLGRYEQGNLDALYDLGVAFSTGSHGTVCDMIEAHKWFNIAGVNGNATGKKNADIIEKKMQPGQIISAIGLAREWLEKI